MFTTKKRRKRKLFYSNCLIEVLKAKFKYWKDTTIIYRPKNVPRRKGERRHFGLGHFYYIKDGLICDFCSFYRPKNVDCNRLLYKGHIRKRTLEDAELQVTQRLSYRNLEIEERIKLAKIMHFPSSQKPGYFDWASYTDDDVYKDEPELRYYFPRELPEKNNLAKYVLIFDSKDFFQIKKIDEIETKGRIFYWWYISPYFKFYGWMTGWRGGDLIKPKD